MLSYLQARAIVESKIQNWHHPYDKLVIVEKGIIEKPYAWIFPYTSQKWLETDDIKYAIAGNAPYFIDKLDGRISRFRSQRRLAALSTLLKAEGMASQIDQAIQIH